MNEPQIHYELFVRRHSASGWTLQMATESRSTAVETADQLLEDKRAIAVKVTKETLNPETREYTTITLLTKGEQAVLKPKARLEEELTPVCTSPSDLYSVYARERIGQLFDNWLRRKTVTPFELLHRADLVEQLDASGMELQHAIQKIAIPDAQSRGVSTHEVMRHYQKLAERTIERVIKDQRRGAFPTVAGSGFGEAVKKLADNPEASYLLGGGVAAHLKAADAWSDKLGLILDLADAAPDTAGKLPFEVLAQPLSEILGSRAALSDMGGEEQDLGGVLAILTRLIAWTEVNALIRIEPALERQFPAPTPQIARLATWLQKPGFAEVRVALAKRILSELNGPRRLRPSDPEGEILVLRALAVALTAFAGSTLSPDDVQAAFAHRSASLVGADFVNAYLAGGDALQEAHALVRLAENVVGAGNKRAAARWISACVGALKFEKALDGYPMGPMAALGQLAELQHALNRVGLVEADQAAIKAKIGDVGGKIEAQAGLVAAVVKAPVSGANRVIKLLRMATGETAPLGPAAARARSELKRLVRAPEIRADLAGWPDLVDRLKLMIAA